MTIGVEDEVESMAVELARDCHYALEVVHRKRDLGTSRKKGGTLVESDATQYID